MNLQRLFISFLSLFMAFPSAVLVFTPMMDKLKGDAKTVLKKAFWQLFFLVAALSLFEAAYHPPYNTLLPLLLVISYLIYYDALDVPVHKSLSIFFLVITYMSFFANFAVGFDAWIHPTGTVNELSLQAAALKALLSVFAAAISIVPMHKLGTQMVNEFDISRGYIISIPVWGIFLGFNLLIVPRKYETLHVNLMQIAYWGVLILLLTLFLLLTMLFYYIVNDLMKAAEAMERNRILEMQKSAYLAQQRYMNETAKVRHDFKHTIGILDMLLKNEDYRAAEVYLDDYIAAQPKNETWTFCGNTAVNALLNYYAQMAKTEDTALDLSVELPENTGISDIDLCSILGNILENAILAGSGIPFEERFVDLVIRVKSGSRLYIVATNAFDGNPRMHGDEYLSTRKTGPGLGLRSIRETAEKYGGSARFTHVEKEFRTDVVLPMKPAETDPIS